MRGRNDSSDNPEALTLDPTTGVFSLVNDAYIKTVYEVEIDVLTTDGINDVIQTITDVTISTVCGPSSTIVTGPELDFLS